MAERVRISVVPMRQKLHEVRGDDDDWTGLTDPKERRKRQNRLHARAWRKRKAQQGHEGERWSTGVSPKQWTKPQAPNPAAMTNITRTSLPITFASPSYPPLPSSTSESGSSPDLYSSNPQPSSITKLPNRKLIPPLIPYLDTHPPPNISTWTITFPLSPDHHLLTLMQFNVLRATMTNLAILSLLDTFPIECGSARALIDLLPVPDTVPPTFTPTELQRTVPHEFWIDAFPNAAMRDNLIRFRGMYDQDELCLDLCGGLYEGFDEIAIRGILVWGEPWLCDGWEVTEGFVRKWGFMLRGCHELVEATNRYRAARGEERLVIEV
ncbi:hypothetical protein GE09DRAFT_1257562 [Coniochaeta sp. 2T2.1]|nr:hypothetical protein GE09DRAFT_1257562 [Coniochaeta sp. 2T2.1]